MRMDCWKLCCVFLLFVSTVNGDTPANCTYEDIKGTWIFAMTDIAGNNTIDCNKESDYTRKIKITLDFPNFAVDEYGNTGFWTLIYNQGFEVVVGGKKYFAFSYYKTRPGEYMSTCSQTLPGWVHNVDERNWDCFVGEKADKNERAAAPKISQAGLLGSDEFYKQPFGSTKDLVNAINSKQSQWKATQYKHFETMKMSDLLRMVGGKRSSGSFPKSAPVTRQHLEVTKPLPSHFDWRDKDDSNFVSPVRNQGDCGSCYAFASMALYEARERIYTNNTVQKVYSTQDVVSCSEYSQGCDGGFPYLTAGKYGQDFGLIEEDCFRYEGKDMPCKKTTCKRSFTRDYYYIGGFYGACNEPLMRAELVKNGPIAVSFQVYKDFQAYKGGIYHHIEELDDKFNPWEITNHVVLIVGYGEEQGTPYWIVKNSWGEDWGEDGFFRIRRGNDECSMESMAVGIHPVV